jgi:hypothetical protein
MAVFGVKGKVETPEGECRGFQFRDVVRFEPEPLHLIYAAVNGTAHGRDFNENEAEVVRSVLLEGANGRDRFDEAVKSLTSRLGSIGPQAAIRALLTPSNAVDYIL